jgi:hypothetical protein
VITFDDIAELVHGRFATEDAGWLTAPGKQWTGRGPDAPDGHPYLVSQVEAGPEKATSGAAYTQGWTVRTAAYCPVGAAGVDIAAVEQLLNAALASADAMAALRAAALRNATEKVLSAKVVPGKGEYARELREGRDVFAAGLTVELLVQGDRSAS